MPKFAEQQNSRTGRTAEHAEHAERQNGAKSRRTAQFPGQNLRSQCGAMVQSGRNGAMVLEWHDPAMVTEWYQVPPVDLFGLALPVVLFLYVAAYRACNRLSNITQAGQCFRLATLFCLKNEISKYSFIAGQITKSVYIVKVDTFIFFDVPAIIAPYPNLIIFWACHGLFGKKIAFFQFFYFCFNDNFII